MNTAMDRRLFVKAAGASCAAVAASAAIGTAIAEEAPKEEVEDWASQVTETIDADIVVVGSGVSGMSAGVEAAQEGLKVIILESAAIRGAVIRSTEGLAAVNSPLQQEQGIEISIPEIIKAEAQPNRYCLNPIYWKQTLDRSGDNIAWLIENGVQFTGVVDNYKNTGAFPTFHWFPGDHEAQTYYGDPMEAEFKKYEGCELRLNTRGRALKMDGDKVAGIYATTPDGVLEINAPAVILASGGYGGDPAEVAKRFPCMTVDKYQCDGAFTNCGDGCNMVISAGGVVDSVHSCFLGTAKGKAVNRAFAFNAINGNAMWVNQDGLRICDESECGGILSIAGMNILFQEHQIYSIYDATMLGDNVEACKEEAVESPDSVFIADTIEELAEKLGIDPAALSETVANWNAMIETGEDTEFGKDLSAATPLVEPPFAAFKQILLAHGNVGGTEVSTKYEVTHPDGTPIPGLYAAGTEANMNYRSYAYHYTVPGGAMCQAVDSGRWAAKNAAKYHQG